MLSVLFSYNNCTPPRFLAIFYIFFGSLISYCRVLRSCKCEWGIMRVKWYTLHWCCSFCRIRQEWTDCIGVNSAEGIFFFDILLSDVKLNQCWAPLTHTQRIKLLMDMNWLWNQGSSIFGNIFHLYKPQSWGRSLTICTRRKIPEKVPKHIVLNVTYIRVHIQCP